MRAARDGTGAPYPGLPCDPAFADTAACCERDGGATEDSASTVVAATTEPRRFVRDLAR